MQQSVNGFAPSDVERLMIQKAQTLLQNGTVTRVLGWKKGLFGYDVTPAVFCAADTLINDFVYNEWCGANLSKYCVKESAAIEAKKATVAANNRAAAERAAKNGTPNAAEEPLPKERVLAFLKPCDTYSFNQLLNEHRIRRENVYVVGVPCLAFRTVRDGESAQNARELERCAVCKSTKHALFDELIGCENAAKEATPAARFNQVAELEAMSAEERYAFWREELSRCIRCNACRNVCPACTCEKCVFDNPASNVAQKANADSFEENLFHIIRAFHVAGRCTDCGECSRVCPEHIPLHLLNRKFIKDINELYGEYQSGESTESERTPLTSFDVNDVEPSVIYERSVKAIKAAQASQAARPTQPNKTDAAQKGAHR